MSEAKHTFSICAYKESPYLEDCILSLINQTGNTKIILCTSTPNESIQKLGQKYHLPIYIRDGESGLKEDWNFAYNMANTQYVTIAHQDDLYQKEYARAVMFRFKQMQDASMCMTDYIPIKNGIVGKKDINSRIRRVLRVPLKCKFLARKSWVRRRVLSLGNSICCPSVTYNKKVLGESIFHSPLEYNIDWDTFYSLAKENAPFAYVDKPLTYYRVHNGATSKQYIENHKREKEDREMFGKFWPQWTVWIIMILYRKAYETYDDKKR